MGEHPGRAAVVRAAETEIGLGRNGQDGCDTQPIIASIEAREVCFAYGALHVLDRVSLQVAPGEVVALLGPSGCGKSTFLRCVAGILEPTSGSVSIQGNCRQRQSRCSFVFQKPTLLSWLSVFENLALPFRLQGKIVPEALLRKHLAKLGLSEFAEAYPTELSLGMAQRICMARALSEQRNVLLLDEPFSSLDDLSKRDLAVALSSSSHDEGVAALLVTHSMHDAAFLADRVCVLTRRPARMIGEVSIALPRPRSADMWMSAALLPFVDQLRGMLEKV